MPLIYDFCQVTTQAESGNYPINLSQFILSSLVWLNVNTSDPNYFNKLSQPTDPE